MYLSTLSNESPPPLLLCIESPNPTLTADSILSSRAGPRIWRPTAPAGFSRPSNPTLGSGKLIGKGNLNLLLLLYNPPDSQRCGARRLVTTGERVTRAISQTWPGRAEWGLPAENTPTCKSVSKSARSPLNSSG